MILYFNIPRYAVQCSASTHGLQRWNAYYFAIGKGAADLFQCLVIFRYS